MNRFDIADMASGGIALVLEPEAAWEDFPGYAKKWAERLGAKQVSEPVITFDECLLEVQVDGGRFWITYDDFQSSIQLEPRDKKYNDIVLSIRKRLHSIA